MSDSSRDLNIALEEKVALLEKALIRERSAKKKLEAKLNDKAEASLYENKEFYDSDRVIEERTGVDIATIFEIEGEQGFRDRETKVLEELSQYSGCVIATGGGSWIEYNVTLPQLESRVGAKIARGAPQVWAYVRAQLLPWFTERGRL